MKIGFEITTATGKTTRYSLPFSIAVLSDLSAGRNVLRLRDRKFREITPDSFDALLERKSPAIEVPLLLPDEGAEGRTITARLEFRSIVDFEPEAVARRIPEIARFVRYKVSHVELLSAAQADYNLEDVIKEFVLNADLRSEYERRGQDALSGLPCWIQARSRLSPERLDVLTAQIADFVAYGRYFRPRVAQEPANLLSAATDHVDGTVQRLIGQVLGHPDFRRLEAAWRSLHYLVNETRGLTGVRIAVFDCSKQELINDQLRAAEPRYSTLYRHLVDEALGTFGAQPFGLLVGDYEFSHRPDDVTLLSDLAELCEAAEAILATAANAAIFDLDQMAELHRPRDLAAVFRRGEYTDWQAFRARLSSRRVVMVVPRFLLREPYDQMAFSLEPVVFTERDHADAVSRCLWANGAFALAVAAARSYQRSGWFGQAKGMDSASPADPLTELPQVWAERLRTEVPLTETRVAELLDLGFTPLCSAEGSAMLGFIGLATCHSRRSDPALGWRNQPCASPDALLSFGRLVHHLKRFGQEKFSAHLDGPTVLRLLDDWIRTIDFSDSSLSDEVEFELQPPAAGRRDYAIRVLGSCGNGEARAYLAASIGLVLA